MTLSPGAESPSGWFTNGTLVDINTISPFVMVASIVVINAANKVVVYGIGFDATANTPVALLLLEE